MLSFFLSLFFFLSFFLSFPFPFNQLLFSSFLDYLLPPPPPPPTYSYSNPSLTPFTVLSLPFTILNSIFVLPSFLFLSSRLSLPPPSPSTHHLSLFHHISFPSLFFSLSFLHFPFPSLRLLLLASITRLPSRLSFFLFYFHLSRTSISATADLICLQS